MAEKVEENRKTRCETIASRRISSCIHRRVHFASMLLKICHTLFKLFILFDFFLFVFVRYFFGGFSLFLGCLQRSHFCALVHTVIAMLLFWLVRFYAHVHRFLWGRPWSRCGYSGDDKRSNSFLCECGWKVGCGRVDTLIAIVFIF